MIRLDPSLVLRRLVVLKSGGSLYDQDFHLGVNIVRGENATGKTTIADFIFFSLGGDVSEWSKEAEPAESVHAEVEINGLTYTLTRELQGSGRPPMQFYEGAFDEAISNRDKWLRYSPTRSAATESFSQVLFRLLGFPELRTDAQQNITMHQLMRLMYCDQMTPVDQIFRLEAKYDTRDLRNAIGELLLGFDDLVLHDIRMQVRDSDRKYGAVVGELQSIFRLLGRTSDADVAAFELDGELRKVVTSRNEMLVRLDELSRARDSISRRELSEKAISISDDLRFATEDVADRSAKLRALKLEVEDSREFLRALGERVAALDASGGMEEYIGRVSFPYCPVCLTQVSESRDAAACDLCKSPTAQSGGNAGRLKMREELTFQIRESSQILQRKIREIDVLGMEVSAATKRRDALMLQVAEFRNRVDPLDAEIASLQQQVGYLNRSIEDLERKAELSALVKSRMREREQLSADLERLRGRLEALESGRASRRESVRHRINELCVEALRADLPMEETFMNSEVVQFDFGANKLSVDGKTRFSASSSTYLKNAFLFSLFRLSLEDPEVRWPRFILLDNIEDKGMQPARSANFQEFVVRKSKESETYHQVILTTSMISPELEDSELCVGRHYLPQNKCLEFARREA